jgi:hypothetical protein
MAQTHKKSIKIQYSNLKIQSLMNLNYICENFSIILYVCNLMWLFLISLYVQCDSLAREQTFLINFLIFVWFPMKIDMYLPRML